MTYRVIAVAVPILWVILAHLGRTGADAHDIAGVETVRRPTAGPAPNMAVPEVRLAQLRPTQSVTEPLLSRNPFTFAPRALSPSPPPSPISIAPLPESHPDSPPSVSLTLIGVATTNSVDGRVERTAIIAGAADALHLVRDGDVVIARYRVDAVLPESVRLVDDTTGASLLLSLR